jgi:hypothetical protein
MSKRLLLKFHARLANTQMITRWKINMRPDHVGQQHEIRTDKRWETGEVEMILANFQNKTDTPNRDGVYKVSTWYASKDFEIK